jgi:DMSO/TMAO reductase YedYZ molybdopterin-dependent catalytic subunit
LQSATSIGTSQPNRGERPLEPLQTQENFWSDRVQAALFSTTRLAPVYSESEITDPFPFDAYYDEAQAPVVAADRYRLEVGGLVENHESWTLDRLYALPQTSQITRHICIEGWSAIGQWSGVNSATFLLS